MDYHLRLQQIDTVTHDTRHLVFRRPKDYRFEPGQATELTVLENGLRSEARPFTFVSQPEDDTLELLIKTYPERDAVTARIADLEPGTEVRITDPFGAIHDEGPGVFIAGGAGLTPFLAILRRRAQQADLEGCTLLFSNKTERDILAADELRGMQGLETHFTVTEQPDSRLAHGRIDEHFLQAHVDGFESERFYVCGPPTMVEAITNTLQQLGAAPDRIVVEA